MTHPRLILVTILIGSVITLFGLSQMHWPTSYSFSADSIYHYLGFLAIGMAATKGLTRWLKIGHTPIAIATVSLISILTGTVWPLFVSLWFALASFALGQAALSALKIDSNETSTFTAFLIGAGIYGTTIGLLAHFPINYPGVYGVALAMPVILGWRSISKIVFKLIKSGAQPTEFKWLDLAITLIALIHFSVALMPEVGHDALAMHLFIPGHLAFHHEWSFAPETYVWAVMPMMGDWIYSIVYMLAGETAPRLINVGFIFALSWLLRDLVIWAGGNALGARWSVLIFLATPLIFLEASSLFIDSVWTAFVIAGSISIFSTLSSSGTPKTHLLVAGILFGSALAAKAVTLTILPIFFVLLIVHYQAWFKKNLARTMLFSLLLFLVIGTIPYITAWHITDNPVFPFFNEYFQAPQYPVVNFSVEHIFEKGVSWDTIYRITFDSSKYLEGKAGAGGFQWLLLLLPTIMLFITTWNRKGLMLISVGILAIVFTFHQTAYLRYIYPSYVLLSAAIGLALSIVFSSPENPLIRRLTLIMVISTVFLNILFFKSGTHYGTIALQPLMSESGRKEYLQHRLPIRNAIDLINKLNINEAPVAIFSAPLGAGLIADALYPSWYNHEFRSLIQDADTANALAEALLNKGVDYIILDENWGSSEKRLIIIDATKEISNIGSISVRVISRKYQFNTELLKDSNFLEGNSWHLSKESKKINDGIIVKHQSSATQIVPVIPGRKYLLSVKARCLSMPSSAKGRLQVNWLDSKSKFVSTNIRVFDCTKAASFHSMKVFSPSHAVKAVLYATGHTNKPLVINEVSFKK